MPKLSLNANHLLIDGIPALIQAGTLHYYRLPHRLLWKPLLDQMRVGGFNAVMIPFPWSYHCPAEGFFDFTGPRDIRFLLDAVKDAGLWLITYVGPWTGNQLGAGGVPPWVWKVPKTLPVDDEQLQSGPAQTYLQHIASWWKKLFPFFIHQPNHILTILHPGQWSFPTSTQSYVQPLCDLALECGIRTPYTWPTEYQTQPWETEESQSGIWLVQNNSQLINNPQENSFPQPLLAINHARQPMKMNVSEVKQKHRQIDQEQPRSQMADSIITGARIIVLDSSHRGCNWGYWSAQGQENMSGNDAVLGEGVDYQSRYLQIRRSTFITETLSHILLAPEVESSIYASPVDNLNATYCTAVGSVAFLESGPNAVEHFHLSYPLDDEMVITEEIYFPAQSTRILPLNQSLAGGTIKSTTLELIMTTEIAGRTLCIVRNENGGSVHLSNHFRPQHIRGGVHPQRITDGWLVHFDQGRLHSIVLDGPEHKIQFLALEPNLADRVWPLDDKWRATPTYAANWSPTTEDPTSGVIIGPDLVVPETNGRYRYLVSAKGFGYRWGPWRGSDPRTWLAPFSWRAPTKRDLPSLIWDDKAGGVEILPDYSDALWRVVPANAPLAMEHFDITAGFICYRGLYDGIATDVTMQCYHDCDVFLNGHLIATLKTPPNFSNGGFKTIPLPERYHQQANVLAIIVENQGRVAELDSAQRWHGLISCRLSPNIPLQWRVKAGFLGLKNIQGFGGYADWHQIPHDGSPHITWYRSEFVLDFEEGLEQSVYLVLEPTPGKTYIYLNGVLIDRSGNSKRQQRSYWLPEGLLDVRGTNELLVMHWTRGAEPRLGQTHLESNVTRVWYTESFNTQ